MRILGLDFGERRIGVALSDPSAIIAQPLAVIERRGLAEDIGSIKALISQHGVESVVMGLPLTLKGERGPQAQRALAFGNELKRATQVAIEWMDERFTTAQGSRALSEAGENGRQQKKRIDQVAAQLILQSYLDSKHAKKTA